MIGFNHLGRLGRLGNQMFQYAALRGISANNDQNFCFPFYKEAVDDGIGNMLRTELFDCFEMSSVVAGGDHQMAVAGSEGVEEIGRAHV